MFNKLKKTIAVLMAITVIFSFNIVAFGAESYNSDVISEKTISIGSDENVENLQNDYYYKKRVYDKKHINQHKNKSIEHKKQIDELQSSNNEIVSIVEYTYSISETYNEAGAIIDSHVMTNEEVLNDKFDLSNELFETRATSRGYFGSDFQTKGYLEIGLVVVKKAYGDYEVQANAYWKTNSKLGGKNRPDATGDDFFGVTWGGKGELKGKILSARGSYQNTKNMPISKAASDSYKGYTWQFLEKNGATGSCMNDLCTTVSIKKTNSKKQNKETNVKCTYIHTFSKVNGSISFTVSKGDSAGSISLSKTEKKWSLECDVPGLQY